MSKDLQEFLVKELNNLEAAGLMQQGLTLLSPQGPQVKIGTRDLINFASDNYLGWANDKRIRAAAKEGVEEFGTSWTSGRLMSGTHQLHRDLEAAVCKLLGTEETVLFGGGYEANLGIFESLFNEQDFIFCDFSLHPSMVDGIRLSGAKHFIFRTQDLTDLEDKLKRSPTARFRAIVVESVSPQDGKITPLNELLALARKYHAIVVLDDSHGLGVLGKTGRGVTEEYDQIGKVDLVSGSFSHALGCGGSFVTGRKEIVTWLKQKARSYLFSSPSVPGVVTASLKAVELLSSGPEELNDLRDNTNRLREGLAEMKFQVVQSTHPIISLVIGDALVTQRMTNRLFQKGIYAMGYCYPVTPRGSARIRLQASAAHLKKDVAAALDAFAEVGRGLKVI